MTESDSGCQIKSRRYPSSNASATNGSPTILPIYWGFAVVQIGRCVLIALATRKNLPESTVPTRRGADPGATGPRWVVANVLVVTTLEFGDPMSFVVLVEPDDSLVHEN